MKTMVNQSTTLKRWYLPPKRWLKGVWSACSFRTYPTALSIFSVVSLATSADIPLEDLTPNVHIKHQYVCLYELMHKCISIERKLWIMSSLKIQNFVCKKQIYKIHGPLNECMYHVSQKAEILNRIDARMWCNEWLLESFPGDGNLDR